MSHALVVHVKNKFDVYVGRPSKWGNPFVIGVDGNRSQVIQKYRIYLMNRPELMNSLPELYAKKLGCHCAPKACHADVLAELSALDHEKRTGAANAS